MKRHFAVIIAGGAFLLSFALPSLAEEKIHPGIYRRRDGAVTLSTISGSGFGYNLEKIDRNLPPPACMFGT